MLHKGYTSSLHLYPRCKYKTYRYFYEIVLYLAQRFLQYETQSIVRLPVSVHWPIGTITSFATIHCKTPSRALIINKFSSALDGRLEKDMHILYVGYQETLFRLYFSCSWESFYPGWKPRKLSSAR